MKKLSVSPNHHLKYTLLIISQKMEITRQKQSCHSIIEYNYIKCIAEFPIVSAKCTLCKTLNVLKVQPIKYLHSRMFNHLNLLLNQILLVKPVISVQR